MKDAKRAGRHTAGLSISALSLGLSMSVLAACETPIPRPAPTVASQVVVPLPQSPELVRKSIKKVFDDGVTYTVAGLLQDAKSLVGQDISVRGVVTKLVVCPEAEPEPAEPGYEARQPRTCNPPPHFFLKDAEQGGSLLVYGSMWSVLPSFKEGQEVSLAGTFDTASKDRVFINQAGLLILDDLPPKPLPPEGATP